MELQQKLEVLSSAAKYDVSCSSSGSSRKNVKGGVGNGHASGICHSWSDDGRCISLLKILMTNYCVYNCTYCVNRMSNDIPRAAFTSDEIVDLTIGFYRRNYIEGLFLSSAVYKDPNTTMELLYETIYKLRVLHKFNGYIHLKAIPGADSILIENAGRLVDRMSVNIELPTSQGLKLLAPQKQKDAILKPMGLINSRIIETKDSARLFRKSPQFVPAGQSTQLIVGATPDHDLGILKLSEGLYKRYNLKRVYYSAYVPVTDHPNLPTVANPPLLREHRLYQADWLLRFYGFNAGELLNESIPNFDTDLDPKSDWAIRNLQLFPVEINRVDYLTLLRVPGIGTTSARKIINARRIGPLSFDDLKKLGVVLKRARFFITCKGRYFGETSFNEHIIRQGLTTGRQPHGSTSPNWEQLSIFTYFKDTPTLEDKILSITGEL